MKRIAFLITMVFIAFKSFGLLVLTTIFILSGCSDNEMVNPGDFPGSQGNNGATNQDDTWLIPRDEIRDGGPGKDGIPALTRPEFAGGGEISYLDDDDLVLGFVDGDDVRAYPHAILDWHEIINDETENHSIAVIYCPLTGTGIGWDRIVDEKETTFGVSGLLYNSNIIPYDRQTDSNWSQLLNQSVNGSLEGTPAKTYNLFETTWKTWRQMYPSTKVVTTRTGYSRNYDRYPYGNYKVDDNLIFPVSNSDARLRPKVRVLGVMIEGKAKAYKFDKTFAGNKVIEDLFQGEKLVVVSNSYANFMVAFKRIQDDETELSFEAVQDSLPVILRDNEGTRWDVFGRGVSGPRKGEQLGEVTQMMGYWFAFPAFYPGLELK